MKKDKKCKISYKKIREKIIERDKEKCVVCGMTNQEHKLLFKNRGISVDHIDGMGIKSKNPNNNFDNLQTLCLRCHGQKDGKRGQGFKKGALSGALRGTLARLYKYE